MEEILFTYSDRYTELLNQAWHPEIAMSFDSLEVRYSNC